MADSNSHTSEVDQLLRELLRRQQVSHKETELGNEVGEYTGEGERLIGHLFKEQTAFIKDPARKKVALCSRRAGKTEAIVAGQGRCALNHPNAIQAYIAPTRGQAKRLFWPKLKKLDRFYKVGIRFNETELVAQFPNKSLIFLAGADKKPDIERLRGLALKKVTLDEGQQYREHLRELVRDIIGPALEDYGGDVELIGTPGRLLSGMFYEATEGSARSLWSQHAWSILDNRKFPRWNGQQNWKRAAKAWLLGVRKENGFTEDDPVYVREYLGKWYRDSSSLVYRYEAGKNDFSKLPPDVQDWHHVVGVDLGFSGFSAFVVGAYSPESPNVYFLRSEKHSGMAVGDVASKIRDYRRQYTPRNVVVDAGGLGQMIIEELRVRYNLPVEPAVKGDKMGHIEAMNSDFRAGRIFVRPGTPLGLEWERLQKTESGEEDTRQHNHCADAALYAYRRCRHYRFKPSKSKPKKGTREYLEMEMAELEQGLADDLKGSSDDVQQMFASGVELPF